MSDRIRVIIKDSGRMLNEMSDGNFAIDTECEEVYTGAFTDLLTGIRKMNEEIATTVRGVDDASGQVLTGSTNLAEAAQSLAEGATDQAASGEEMQATINELTSGIKTTAEELGTAYDEAYKYAEIAEGSRGDMEVLVQAMSRINETSEKIGAIITQIEDIASQTSLLSLNASIEAARAGEAGRGFAVVAEQIGQLAQQSDTSARQIETIVQELMHNSAVTVENMNEVVDNTKEQAEKLNATKLVFDSLTTGVDSVTDVSDKIQSQAAALEKLKEEISDMVNTLASISEENAASCEETSASMQVLNDTINTCTNDTNQLVEMSEMLQKLAGHFKLE